MSVVVMMALFLLKHSKKKQEKSTAEGAQSALSVFKAWHHVHFTQMLKIDGD